MKPAPPVTRSFTPPAPRRCPGFGRLRFGCVGLAVVVPVVVLLLRLRVQLQHGLAADGRAGGALALVLLGLGLLAPLQVVGEPSLPVGELDRGLAAAAQHRVGGARRGPLHHVGGRAHHPGDHLGLAGRSPSRTRTRSSCPRPPCGARRRRRRRSAAAARRPGAPCRWGSRPGRGRRPRALRPGPAAASSRRSSRPCGPNSHEVRTMKLWRLTSAVARSPASLERP